MTQEDKDKSEAMRGYNSKSVVITLDSIYKRYTGTTLGNKCNCSKNNRIEKIKKYYEWYEENN